MNEEKIEKGIYDVASAQQDFNKCVEYEIKICRGEKVVVEANKFAVDKINEIYGKSPEIIAVNRVVYKNEPITVQTALNCLAIAKKVINDQYLKDSANLVKDSVEELKKENNN